MTATSAAPSAAKTGTPEVLALADGVELLGEFEDSGFRRPPLLARRPDGQMVQLTRLLYLTAEACDGRRDAEAVAAVVSERFGRTVSAANVRQVAEEQLRPQGVLALADGTSPEPPKRVALLALRHRRPILSERVVNIAAAGLSWLHVRPLKAALLVALALFDAWLFGIHGIAGGVRTVLYEPGWLLALLASIVVATVFHELGHASACRYGGARPGVMGVGVYLIWPAFYCDVTDAYRLNRKGRLRTDLGGVYFNGLFALAAGGAYFATGQETLLFAAFVQHIIVLQQLLPLLRFDGYYVLSDLTGVPDILSRIKPIFRSLVRGARNEPRVAELKPWVRVAVTAYLLVLVPLLTLMIGSIVMAAPRMFATAYDSFWLQLDRMRAASGAAEAGVGAFRICALVMPLAAMTLSLTRSGKMAGRGLARWASGSAVRTAAALAATVAAIGAAVFVWWPNGDYAPIRPGERGTIGEAIRSVPAIPSGRPSFTPERARHYGAAPTVREIDTARRREAREQAPPSDPGQAPGTIDDGGAVGTEPSEDPGTSRYPEPDATDAPSGAEPEPGASPSPSASPAPATPAPTGTPSPSPSDTPTATPTPTPSATSTPSPTPAAATSPAPEETAATTPSPGPTETEALSVEPTLTPTPTPTP